MPRVLVLLSVDVVKQHYCFAGSNCAERLRHSPGGERSRAWWPVAAFETTAAVWQPQLIHCTSRHSAPAEDTLYCVVDDVLGSACQQRNRLVDSSRVVTAADTLQIPVSHSGLGCLRVQDRLAVSSQGTTLSLMYSRPTAVSSHVSRRSPSRCRVAGCGSGLILNESWV